MFKLQTQNTYQTWKTSYNRLHLYSRSVYIIKK